MSFFMKLKADFISRFREWFHHLSARCLAAESEWSE